MDYQTKDGVKLYSDQDPYLECNPMDVTETVFMCNAIDAEGNDYKIIWGIDNPDANDEFDMVKDWTDYRVI